MKPPITVSVQCDQGGYPFVLLTYKVWAIRKGEMVIEDGYHHLSFEEARQLATELLEVSIEKSDDPEER